MRHVIFYTKENCPLCDEALALLEMLRHEYVFNIEQRNIYTKDEWLEEYQLQIPVVIINDEITLNCEEINYEALEKAMQACDE